MRLSSICCGARRQAGSGLRQGFRRRHPCPVPGKDAGLQLLTLVQLEEESRRCHHRQVPSRNSAPWVNKFQFITLAGFHSLNYSCSISLTATLATRCRPSSSCRKPSLPPSTRASLRQAPARSRHRLLRRRDPDIEGSQSSTHSAQGLDEVQQFFDRKVANA